MATYLIWFILGTIFLFAELACPGFIIFFFGVGAILTSIAVGLNWVQSLEVQLGVFIVASLVTLAVGRVYMRRLFSGKSEVHTSDADDDNFIGRTTRVVEQITPETPGRIELNGSTWMATADATFEVGAIVKIVRRSNITFHVQ